MARAWEDGWWRLRSFGIACLRWLQFWSLRMEETLQERVARKIFGQQFVGIPEITVRFGGQISVGRIPIPFSREELRVRSKTHWLVLDPGTPTRDIIAITGGGDWERRKMEPYFHRAEKPTWRLVRMRAPEKAVGRVTWHEQEAVAKEMGEHIMGVRALVVVGTFILWARGFHLFAGQARTSDRIQTVQWCLDERVWLTNAPSSGRVFTLGSPYLADGGFHACTLDKDDSDKRVAGVQLEYRPESENA